MFLFILSLSLFLISTTILQVLKGIQHPAIIAAEDIFLRRETLLIILPLCEGLIFFLNGR